MSSGLGRALPGRQAPEGPAQEQGGGGGGQEEGCCDEEGPAPLSQTKHETHLQRAFPARYSERSKQRNKHRQAGKGIFKPVTLSSALAKVTGISGKATRGAVTKAVWAYIKSRAGHFSVFSACSDSPGFWSNRTASRACTVRPSPMVVARVRGVFKNCHSSRAKTDERLRPQEEGFEQGPDGRQDRGHLRWRLDVQARRRREQAPEVSGCVFFLVNSARGSAGC